MAAAGGSSVVYLSTTTQGKCQQAVAPDTLIQRNGMHYWLRIISCVQEW
jgi:hypothetical protein